MGGGSTDFGIIPKKQFFYWFPFASVVICSACIFPTLQRLNTKKDLDWNLLIQLCFVNKKLRKTERISYSTGIHPERGPPLKVFLFSRICNCRSAYFSKIQKRPLLGLCWLILSEGVFLTNCIMEEEDLIFYWEGWMRVLFIFGGSKWVGLCDLNHMWIW